MHRWGLSGWCKHACMLSGKRGEISDACRCDNCIIGTMAALQMLSCFCSILACLTQSSEIDQAAYLIDIIADTVWCVVCGCMQTQVRIRISYMHCRHRLVRRVRVHADPSTHAHDNCLWNLVHSGALGAEIRQVAVHLLCLLHLSPEAYISLLRLSPESYISLLRLSPERGICSKASCCCRRVHLCKGTTCCGCVLIESASSLMQVKIEMGEERWKRLGVGPGAPYVVSSVDSFELRLVTCVLLAGLRSQHIRHAISCLSIARQGFNEVERISARTAAAAAAAVQCIAQACV
jgi:hypothetical protein